jgi:hypothetical protein
VRRLSFAKKMALLELIEQRHPKLLELAKEWYPEFDGEVPFSWLLSEEYLEELIKEVQNEGN